MPEFIIPGEDDASVFPEYFEKGRLKPEYRECVFCGKPNPDGCCEKCWKELCESEEFQ